ncbi:MAG: molecular chaperone HtpG [Bulleidia sp.]|nr:molecular chaperone HtpG [Erysipelotrichaceae bacterium]MDY2781755.1 molecular chaperone HtpG [Bulleidia sp.]
MAKKQFKAESKRLLGLMINSIYTNKEIFLRELISNASDALDKRYYVSLTDETKKVDKKDLYIQIERDIPNKTLVIEDTGIGMTNEELEKNLGTIAKSGSADFKEQLEKSDKNVDIIGQFGVGFYSAFMVADKITVESRSLNSDKAYKWESTGEDGYTISEIERDKIGTKITLHIKDDTDDEKYSEYLEESKIENLVKKYSDYVRYPIQMEVEKAIPDPTDDKKTITTTEMETLNSMIPLWKKHPSQITKEDYNEFYKAKFNDWQDPLKVIHYSVEGNISYTALLFIPATLPYNFYNTDFEGGLQLYSKGVFIMDKAKELLPESYRFVTGLIDSEDLSLNISREILQQDRQVKALAKSIEKKIHGALIDMMKDDRENYEKFFRQFGKNIKYDIYKSYGMNADKLKDLLMYESSKEDKYVSLSEYVSRMSENQKDIYYACGTSVSEIKKLPVFDKLMDKGYEVLYFTDPVDEFSITMMHQFEEHEFKNITNSDLDLDSDEEKKEREEKTEENKDMLALMKEALGDNVKDVRISSRLKDDPVCLVADAGMSLEMEKILSQDPANSGMKASKILEINADHPIFATLEKLFKENPDTVKEYASVLYDQALLIQGLEIKDPVEYAKKITSLMIQAAK